MSFFGSTEWFIEVGKGNVDGHSIVNIVGRNSDVGQTFEDISGLGLLFTFDYDAQTADFTPGLELSGASATAMIVADIDNGAAGTLIVRKVSGTFVDNETITDSGAGSADAMGIPAAIGGLSYPSAGGQTWELICESSNDTIAGTGARTILTTYLDDDFNKQTTVTNTNGQTASVFTPTDARRHISSVVIAWGTQSDEIYGATNLGSILIRDSSTKDIMSVIEFDDSVSGDEHGLNNTRDSYYTVDAGKTAFLLSPFTNTSKNHEVNTIFLVRLDGLAAFLGTGQVSVYQNSVGRDTVSIAQGIAEKTDLKFISRSDNASVDVNVSYGLLLVDN